MPSIHSIATALEKACAENKVTWTAAAAPNTFVAKYGHLSVSISMPHNVHRPTLRVLNADGATIASYCNDSPQGRRPDTLDVIYNSAYSSNPDPLAELEALINNPN